MSLIYLWNMNYRADLFWLQHQFWRLRHQDISRSIWDWWLYDIPSLGKKTTVPCRNFALSIIYHGKFEFIILIRPPKKLYWRNKPLENRVGRAGYFFIFFYSSTLNMVFSCTGMYTQTHGSSKNKPKSAKRKRKLRNSHKNEPNPWK